MILLIVKETLCPGKNAKIIQNCYNILLQWLKSLITR